MIVTLPFQDKFSGLLLYLRWLISLEQKLKIGVKCGIPVKVDVSSLNNR